MFYCSSVVMIVGLVKLNDRLSCSIDRSAGQTGIWAQQRENAYMHGRYLWTQFRWFRPALYTKSQWAYVSTHSTNAWLFATPRLAGTCWNEMRAHFNLSSRVNPLTRRASKLSDGAVSDTTCCCCCCNALCEKQQKSLICLSVQEKEQELGSMNV